MCKSGKGAAATVNELGLVQVSDEGAIAAAIDKVLAAEPAKVAEYRARPRQALRLLRRPGDEGDGRQGQSQGPQRNPQSPSERLTRAASGGAGIRVSAVDC